MQNFKNESIFQLNLDTFSEDAEKKMKQKQAFE